MHFVKSFLLIKCFIFSSFENQNIYISIKTDSFNLLNPNVVCADYLKICWELNPFRGLGLTQICNFFTINKNELFALIPLTNSEIIPRVNSHFTELNAIIFEDNVLDLHDD